MTTTTTTTLSLNTTSSDKTFRVRTITYFLPLDIDDFNTLGRLDLRVQMAATFLAAAKRRIETDGIEVQTCRLATSPFHQWMDDDTLHHLGMLDAVLERYPIINMCAIGPAETVEQVSNMCDTILRHPSYRFSCSANVSPNDIKMADACAKLVVESLSDVENGLGNFRFCTTSCVMDGVPFFPAAKAKMKTTDDDSPSSSGPSFALGLENGILVDHLLRQCRSIQNIPIIFKTGLIEALLPLQAICESLSLEQSTRFAGIDTSINPSLDTTPDSDTGNVYGGSIAAAMETLDEIHSFGGMGTIAVAAAMTLAIQSLDGITKCGYCGLMLPICEDRRLAQLGPDHISITNLLSISQICGVGVDTVPIPGGVNIQTLSSLYLDVAAIAHRWNKPLSCRVFPVIGKVAGDITSFDDSPYLVNTKIFDL